MTDVTRLAALVDHTLLAPNATRDQIERVADEAVRFGFAAVCVNPIWVSTVAERLAGSHVATCTVVGFPLGATPTSNKVHEAIVAIEDGAQEIDMVVNIADALGGERDALEADIRHVTDAVHAREGIVKVIVESGYLDDERLRLACEASVSAGADFVKTSTGFNCGGATVHAVEVMHAAVSGRARVKASGGIRTLDEFEAMVAAGADRIGTSRAPTILFP